MLLEGTQVLQEQLSLAVDAEEFETAAQLRQQVRTYTVHPAPCA
jgi:protein-arginine kinase activator protein McsA